MASRASIKRAVLAARLLKKTDKTDAEALGPESDSSAVPAASGAATVQTEGFRGGAIASKARFRRQLSRRRSNSGGEMVLLT